MPCRVWEYLTQVRYMAWYKKNIYDNDREALISWLDHEYYSPAENKRYNSRYEMEVWTCTSGMEVHRF